MAKDEDELPPPLERAQLDAWAVPAVRDGFADRVVAGVGAVRRVPSRWPALLGAFALGAAAAAMTLLLLRGQPEPVVRQVAGRSETLTVAAVKTHTMPLGDRAVAVLEPGAVLTWTGTAARLSSGRAFFRVDRGPSEFSVITPAGRVEVLGTCFTVDATDARTHVVTHEGRVRLVGLKESLELTAGQAGELSASGARRTGLQPDVAPTLGTGNQALAPPSFCPPCEDDGTTAFEPGEEALRRWAAECRIRSDMPPFGIEQSEEDLGFFLKEVGAAASEATAFRESLAAIHGRIDERIATLYVVATGDEAGPARMSHDDMFHEIMRSAEYGEEAALRQRLAEERAGLRDPPGPGAAMTPYEELTRQFMALADDLEAELGRRIGAGRARELRRKHGGWPGPGYHMIGCP